MEEGNFSQKKTIFSQNTDIQTNIDTNKPKLKY